MPITYRAFNADPVVNLQSFWALAYQVISQLEAGKGDPLRPYGDRRSEDAKDSELPVNPVSRQANTSMAGSLVRATACATALLLATLAGAQAASGESHESGDEVQEESAVECDERNQKEMNICAERMLRSSDRAMESMLMAAKGRLAASDLVNLLEASQRAWTTYIEADCQLWASPLVNGSAYPFALNSCKARHKRLRAKNLGALANCTQNGCPQ